MARRSTDAAVQPWVLLQQFWCPPLPSFLPSAPLRSSFLRPLIILPAGGENECFRCTRCAVYRSKCTPTTDADCASDPMVVFAEIVYFYFTTVFGLAVVAWYLVYPFVEWRRRKVV